MPSPCAALRVSDCVLAGAQASILIPGVREGRLSTVGARASLAERASTVSRCRSAYQGARLVRENGRSRRRVGCSMSVEPQVDDEVDPKKPEYVVGKFTLEDVREEYAVRDTGVNECQSCGYRYVNAEGDPGYPIAAGTAFADLPQDWRCPICGAPQSSFESKAVQVSGFVQNQAYGLGTNSMTSEQKNLLIWGTLIFFFLVFMSGYFLN